MPLWYNKIVTLDHVQSLNLVYLLLLLVRHRRTCHLVLRQFDYVVCLSTVTLFDLLLEVSLESHWLLHHLRHFSQVHIWTVQELSSLELQMPLDRYQTLKALNLGESQLWQVDLN